MPQFQAWPKIPRFNRGITISEKIDGSNAAVQIVTWDQVVEEGGPGSGMYVGRSANGEHAVYAQSRKRLITPENDNFGFAAWTRGRIDWLVEHLGQGIHFGEWHGPGIQKNPNGLTEKRFSLFNTKRWGWLDKRPGEFDSEGHELAVTDFQAAGVGVVPILYTGQWMVVNEYDGDEFAPDNAILYLKAAGSRIIGAEGTKAEGIIIYTHASGTYHKVLCEHDELPKGVVTAQERATAAVH